MKNLDSTNSSFNENLKYEYFQSCFYSFFFFDPLIWLAFDSALIDFIGFSLIAVQENYV